MNRPFTISRIVELCSIPRSIDFIIRNLDGIDPIALSALLKELEKEEIIRKHDDDYWIAEEKARLSFSEIIDLDAPPFIKRFMGQFNLFKKPHPLDFEWRNSPNTVRYLSEKVLQFAG
ncbi:MAG: hypothetical protein JST06_11925 [Bacteroidetes bacterium]|nr:hypothetical protein [Bacteroidota bacterium]